MDGWDRKWSLQVRQRDNYTCQVCGNSSSYVNAHHIETRSIKSLRYCLENGLTLCAQCHLFNHNFSAHKTPEAFKQWFQKHFSLRWEIIQRLKKQHVSTRDAIQNFRREVGHDLGRK